MKRKAELLEILAGYVCNYNGTFEDIINVFSSIEELIEFSGYEGEEIASAVFFGDIKNWQDDYFYINGCGNFESCLEMEHEKSILNQEKEIISEFLDIYGECLETEHLEILSELKALGSDISEGLDV
ncbi:hypothetical protein [Fusobacterium phage Fnu1]|uniref:CDI immunity protein domain-containing protein n=1 Tax=Fusobacterium phage Fnu1 TaxID=2530024 RepID=A0A481W5L7_9CAUD|nr:hypothetical protein KMD24_gp045 [Fusobacterium phage Fnu1]QBJ04164.1 hypothetical protein [Fusobacterium phage Fnu1]